jgi:hypothetical protein
MSDSEILDERSARAFFGFAPREELDAFMLRSRKFDKDMRARSEEEKQRIQQHFDILAPLAGIRATPRDAPTARQPEPQARRDAPAIRIANDPGPSSEVQSVLDRLSSQLDHAINAEVIGSTIMVYRSLFKTMAQLASYLDMMPRDVDNATVRGWLMPPNPQTISRAQIEKILQLLPEDLHTSLGGTPEFNHPTGMYASSPESASGLLFRHVIQAIREKALDRRRELNAGL